MNHNWLSGKGEQRENIQSWCLSIGNVSGVILVASMLLQFGDLPERSFTDQHLFQKIYSRFTKKIHVFAKSDHSFLLRRGTACSLCWAFLVENPSLSTSPLMNLPETDHPKYSMHKSKHLYQKDLIKSYMEFYVHPTDFSWIMWM